jgi:pimeloyl-ACP methyl ester carboxylesterase
MSSPVKCLILIFLALFPALAQAPDIAGSWEGTLETPSGKLRLRIHVARQPDGALSAKMDSVDQGANGIPITTISFAEGALKWGLSMAGASYEGKITAAGDAIEGTFTQGLSFPLTFKRMTAPPPPPKRPQTPQPPFPYTAEDVTFPSKATGVTMAGTLTLPKGAGPHPAVILITGSGAQDRDETLMDHKPFAVLADHLTRNGIAVLRYDDRGVAKSTGDFKTSTSLDFSYDAEGALDFLLRRKEIDPKRIGFLGHSEGGMIAPMLAARRPEIAFLVLMAGPGVNGEQILYAQGEALLKAQGASAEAIESQRAVQEKMFTIVKEEKDPAAAAKKLRESLPGAPAIDAQIARVNSPWFRYFLTYEPGPALEKVECPVLALNGTLDLQVVPDQNLPAIEAALKKGGNKDFQLVRIPGVNHLLQPAKTGSVGEYAQTEITMLPAALDTITKWLRAHTGLEK